MNNSCLYVDMNILRENVETIATQLPADCCIIPVLKDDAYGLGQLKIASCLCEFDKVRCVAVAHVSEGLSLRAGGITKDILVMGSPLPHQLEAAVLTQLTLCVPSLETAKLVDETAAALSMEARVQTSGISISSKRFRMPFFSSSSSREGLAASAVYAVCPAYMDASFSLIFSAAGLFFP